MFQYLSFHLKRRQKWEQNLLCVWSPSGAGQHTLLFENQRWLCLTQCSPNTTPDKLVMLTVFFEESCIFSFNILQPEKELGIQCYAINGHEVLLCLKDHQNVYFITWNDVLKQTSEEFDIEIKECENINRNVSENFPSLEQRLKKIDIQKFPKIKIGKNILVSEEVCWIYSKPIASFEWFEETLKKVLFVRNCSLSEFCSKENDNPLEDLARLLAHSIKKEDIITKYNLCMSLLTENWPSLSTVDVFKQQVLEIGFPIVLFNREKPLLVLTEGNLIQKWFRNEEVNFTFQKIELPFKENHKYPLFDDSISDDFTADSMFFESRWFFGEEFYNIQNINGFATRIEFMSEKTIEMRINEQWVYKNYHNEETYFIANNDFEDYGVHNHLHYVENENEKNEFLLKKSHKVVKYGFGWLLYTTPFFFW
jgi:hypothetical protein